MTAHPFYGGGTPPWKRDLIVASAKVLADQAWCLRDVDDTGRDAGSAHGDRIDLKTLHVRGHICQNQARVRDKRHHIRIFEMHLPHGPIKSRLVGTAWAVS
jgi:hypothetical protein